MSIATERTIIAFALVAALFYVLIFKEGAVGSFMNLMFLVVGYYFGTGRKTVDREG